MRNEVKVIIIREILKDMVLLLVGILRIESKDNIYSLINYIIFRKNRNFKLFGVCFVNFEGSKFKNKRVSGKYSIKWKGGYIKIKN